MNAGRRCGRNNVGWTALLMCPKSFRHPSPRDSLRRAGTLAYGHRPSTDSDCRTRPSKLIRGSIWPKLWRLAHGGPV